MGRFGFILFAALACIAAHSAEPKKWYAPQTGWDSDVEPGQFYIYKDGEPPEVYTVGYDGISESLENKIASLSNPTIQRAYYALYEALRAQVMAKNISDNLNLLLFSEGIQITPQGGKPYTVKFGSSLKEALDKSSSGTIEATSTEDWAFDGVSIQEYSAGRRWDSDIQAWTDIWRAGIAGWTNANPKTSYSLGQVLSGDPQGVFSDTFGPAAHVLARSTEGRLGYMRIGNAGGGAMRLDGKSISTNSSNEVELKGWESWEDRYGLLGRTSGGDLTCKTLVVSNGLARTEDDAEIVAGLEGWESGPCEANLGEMLSDPQGESAEFHLFLAKYTKDGEESLHYVPIGSAGIASPDGESVTTNENGKIQIANFESTKYQEGLIPVTGVVGMDRMEINWVHTNDLARAGGGALRFVGTDSSEATAGSGSVTNTVTFASETNSNVSVSVAESDGNITVKIGVYYR